MKKLALIHTAPFMVAEFKKLLAKRYPNLESFHMVDESLIQDARQAGGMTPAIVRRIAGLCGLAQDAGAEVILFTCSSTSPAVDPVRPLLNVPVLKIDDAMAAKAVRSGAKIGLLCTSKTTVAPSTQILEHHAAQVGRDIEIELVVDNDAYFAMRGGDKESHDKAVRAAAKDLAGRCEVIVLAQASMAHLAEELSETLKIPVLESPSHSVEFLSGLLAD